MDALAYPPHITLAIYDNIHLTDLVAVFDSAFACLRKTKVRFGKLGCFETPDALILWAEPTLPGSIRSIHDHIHRSIEVNLCRPAYRPESWVPHCSLATAISPSRKQEAMAIVRRSIEPIEVELDVADCVSFMPVEVIRERELAGDA
jgi:2'-5' RNA ligase